MNKFPVLPLRDVVLFPSSVPPLLVGRKKSICALESALVNGSRMLLVTQRSANVDDPQPKDLYKVGLLCTVLQVLKLPDNALKVLVNVESRAIALNYIDSSDLMQAEVEAIEDEYDSCNEMDVEALRRSILKGFENCTHLGKKISLDVLNAVNQIEDKGRLADTIAYHLDIKALDKQKVLEAANILERLELVYGFIESEIGVLNVEKRIRNRVKLQMENTQRVYYLNEQMKAIQKELGENEGGEVDENIDLEKKIKKVKLSKEARDKAKSELKKLKMMSPMSAEATVVRNYLDWLLALPWGNNTKCKFSIEEAQQVLDVNHYAMEKVKEHVLEYLAVQKRLTKVKGTILCLFGPPGVGKTSLARSIAKATGREFARISLGGVKDESEIRGHRKTYIGSMPGKIIYSLKKAKSNNPLILLDEIDKISSDFRGDPSSALLEVLDSEQNSTFVDHYLEVEYDLSDVMFIATANTLDISSPLLDRMEIVRISGYTGEEKAEIAIKHLIPVVKEETGLTDKEWSISKEALRNLIRSYTKESGVRNLRRELGKLMRKALRQIISSKEVKSVNVKISVLNLASYAGVPKYSFGMAETSDLIGISTGLAYTETGGELLNIEAVTVPGKGEIKITGKLGDVMKESVQAAFSYVKSRANEFSIRRSHFTEMDIHLHVPEGAVPKDGPSAGAAIGTAIVSLLSRIPVNRYVAMTGEINLRGKVSEIGGLKEKLLAAARGGIKIALIPKDNVKNLEDIPENVKKLLKIVPVGTLDEVLQLALTSVIVPITEKDGEVFPVKKKCKNKSSDSNLPIQH